MKLAEAYVDITTRTRRFAMGLTALRLKLVAGLRRMAAIAARWAIRIGIALAAAFTAAIWAATKFEKQLAMVSTMLTKTTMRAMRGFETGIKRLAVAYGQSTETLAKGLYDILSASISASKAIGVLETASRAAIAGMTDTAVAVDVITTVLNSYQMSAADADRVSDALFATVKAGKLTFAELARFLGMVTAPAAAAGEKLEELLAALATLTRAGVRPRIAVTYLRQALMTFAKATPDAQRAADKFGLSLTTNTLQTIGLIGVLKKLENATAEQMAAIFVSNEAYNAMITLRGDLIGLERDLAAQLDATGSTMEAYNKMAETMDFQLKRLKQSVVILAGEIGKIFLPALKNITKWILKNGETIKFFVYNTVAKAWNKLLDIIAISDTVFHNWSNTIELVMDTAGFAMAQFAKNARYYLVEGMKVTFKNAQTEAINWATKLLVVGTQQQKQWREQRELRWKHGFEDTKAFHDAEKAMAERHGKEMLFLESRLDIHKRGRVSIAKRIMSEEDKAIEKSLADRWAEWSKDLAKRSKKYDKYRVTIITKEMQMYQKLFDMAKQWWDRITNLFTEGEKKMTKITEEEVAKRKKAKEPEFVGLEEMWRRMHLAALKIDVKAPTVGPKAPEKIQQGQLTELQQIKKAGQATVEWLKKLVEKEPTPAVLR